MNHVKCTNDIYEFFPFQSNSWFMSSLLFYKNKVPSSVYFSRGSNHERDHCSIRN